MDKNKLIELRKRLLALGVAGGMLFVTSGCDSTNDNEVSKREVIETEYSQVSKYYDYAIKDGEPVKKYKAENIYLLYDKNNYEVSEFIYFGKGIVFDLFSYIELYDLESEEMLFYHDGLGTSYNSGYYHHIMSNNYQVCLTDAENYVEGHIKKDSYTLEEIRELEPIIADSLKIINEAKSK